jgi:hypothetical protein
VRSYLYLRDQSWDLEDDAEMDSDDRAMVVGDMHHYTEYVLPNSEEPNLITQSELNYLVRDLNLSKNQAEILGSKLQG